jgi:tRNA modification GTPase
LVTETIDLDGLRVTLVDTAGLRRSDDIVESEGVRRAEQAAHAGDLIVFVTDRSQPWPGERWQSLVSDLGGKRVLAVANKADLPPAWTRSDAVEVSAKTGDGIGELRRRVAAALDFEVLAERPAITNIRHIALVETAEAAFQRARNAVGSEDRSVSEEFVLADLQSARAALEEVVGRRAPEDVLAHIFERFCVGK